MEFLQAATASGFRRVIDGYDLTCKGACQPWPTQLKNLDITLEESDSLRFKLVAHLMGSDGVGAG